MKFPSFQFLRRMTNERFTAELQKYVPFEFESDNTDDIDELISVGKAIVAKQDVSRVHALVLRNRAKRYAGQYRQALRKAGWTAGPSVLGYIKMNIDLFTQIHDVISDYLGLPRHGDRTWFETMHDE